MLLSCSDVAVEVSGSPLAWCFHEHLDFVAPIIESCDSVIVPQLMLPINMLASFYLALFLLVLVVFPIPVRISP